MTTAPDLFPRLSNAQREVMYNLYMSPLENNKYIYERAFSVEDTMYKGLHNVIARNTGMDDFVVSRMTLFTELGYITPTPLYSEYEPLRKLTQALSQRDYLFANHATLARVTGYAKNYVNTLIRRLYDYHGMPVDYNDDTSTQYRRLQFYAHVGWFDVARLQRDAQVQYAELIVEV